MKIFRYFYCSGDENEKNTYALFDKYQNSLLEKVGKNFYFKSKYKDNKEKVKIKRKQLIFDTDLAILINKIIMPIVFRKAQEWSPEPLDISYSTGHYSSGIASVVQKYQYEEQPKIINFACELFYKFITSHYFINGNKRIGFALLITLLSHFGFYFFWTSNKIYMQENSYETKLKYFVAEHEKWHDDAVYSEVLNWLKSSIVISINYTYQ